MVTRHKKPRHDLIVDLHLKICGAAEKSCDHRGSDSTVIMLLLEHIVFFESLNQFESLRYI